MLIDEKGKEILYFRTNQEIKFQLPQGLENETFKVSVREKPDPNTPSMADATGTVSSGYVTFNLYTGTEEFFRVSKLNNPEGYIEIYIDTNGSREVLLQKKIIIKGRYGTLDGQVPAPVILYVKTYAVMPGAAAVADGQAAIYTGENTATYTKGHIYKAVSGAWQDITAGGGTSDYNALQNRPKINSVTLSGDKTAADLGLVTAAREINGKPLSSDVTLAASDVGAVPTSRKVNGKALSSDVTLAASDVGAVPEGRKVNGKPLSSDVTLAASDVGAVEKPSGQTANKYLGTDAQNQLAWKTVEEPDYPVTSVNGKTGDVELKTSDVPMPVVALAGTAVTEAGKIYTHTVAAGEIFTFFTPVAGEENLFELDLTQPATAVTFTLPTISWRFGVPDFGTGGKIYYIKFRNTGGGWEGWTTPEMSEYLKNVETGINRMSWTCNSNPIGHGTREFMKLDVNNRPDQSTPIDYLYLTPFILYINPPGGLNINTRNITLAGRSGIAAGAFCIYDYWDGHITVPGSPYVQNSRGYVDCAYVKFYGQYITALTSSTISAIPAVEGVVYTYTLTGGETITLGTPTAGYMPTLELHLTQPATAVTPPSFPAGTKWFNASDGSYKASNPAPDLTAGGTVYALEFRYTGAVWLGKLLYKEQ